MNMIILSAKRITETFVWPYFTIMFFNRTPLPKILILKILFSSLDLSLALKDVQMDGWIEINNKIIKASNNTAKSNAKREGWISLYSLVVY